MLVVYLHGSREIEHGSTFQCWQGKVLRKDCEWVQPAQVTEFKVRLLKSIGRLLSVTNNSSYMDETQHVASYDLLMTVVQFIFLISTVVQFIQQKRKRRKRGGSKLLLLHLGKIKMSTLGSWRE